jgi:Arc/MetJ-type ribon-helix-helix transcriptional regulator
MIDKAKTTKLQIYIPKATARRIRRHAMTLGFPSVSQWIRRAVRLQLELEESKFQTTLGLPPADEV